MKMTSKRALIAGSLYYSQRGVFGSYRPCIRPVHWCLLFRFLWIYFYLIYCLYDWTIKKKNCLLDCDFCMDECGREHLSIYVYLNLYYFINLFLPPAGPGVERRSFIQCTFVWIDGWRYRCVFVCFFVWMRKFWFLVWLIPHPLHPSCVGVRAIATSIVLALSTTMCILGCKKD